MNGSGLTNGAAAAHPAKGKKASPAKKQQPPGGIAGERARPL